MHCLYSSVKYRHAFALPGMHLHFPECICTSRHAFALPGMYLFVPACLCTPSCIRMQSADYSIINVTVPGNQLHGRWLLQESDVATNRRKSPRVNHPVVARFARAYPSSLFRNCWVCVNMHLACRMHCQLGCWASLGLGVVSTGPACYCSCSCCPPDP